MVVKVNEAVLLFIKHSGSFFIPHKGIKLLVTNKFISYNYPFSYCGNKAAELFKLGMKEKYPGTAVINTQCFEENL